MSRSCTLANMEQDAPLRPEEEIRREKRDRLRSLGMDPYSVDVNRNTMIGDAIIHFQKLSEEAKQVIFAGRVMSVRVHGGMMFADVMDISGTMQIAFKVDECGAEIFEKFRDNVDPGDIIEASGLLFVTKRGEQSLNVQAWHMLSKSLLPLPEKWHGLQDVEKRFREREMDLISNPEVRQRFIVRSLLVSSLRRFLDTHGFMEVETPMMQPIPGGASAKPFVTHHEALDIDLYMRIAPEIYLKRLLVGGFEKIYEIGRCFRNEGIDHSHNPEFTMLEMYWAYASKSAYISFLEEMVRTIVKESIGESSVIVNGKPLEFGTPWKSVTFREAIMESCGIDINLYPDADSFVSAVKKADIAIDFSGCIGMGEYYDTLFKKTARPQIVQPTWVFDYPIEIKPLTRVNPEDPTKSACVQMVVCGTELLNVYYHELHDADLQRERLDEQQVLRDSGSDEAQWKDDAFLRALDHGMPPTSGMGLGIDRLVSIITGADSLKEVLFFPTLRPENSSDNV